MSLLTLSKRVLGKGEKPTSKKKTKKEASDKKTFQSVPGGGTADEKPKKEAKDTGKTSKTKKTEKVTVSVMAAQIGLTPMITERSVMQQQHNVVVFRVRPEASKEQVRIAVKEKFNVQPLSVRTANFKAKRRQRGRTVGKTIRWKKAYVQVDDIQKLTTTP